MFGSKVSQDSTHVVYSDELDSTYQYWKPSFDKTTENIYWFNTKTKEILNMDNPLFD